MLPLRERERGRRDTLNFASFNSVGVLQRSVLNRMVQSDNVPKDLKTDLFKISICVQQNHLNEPT